MTELSLASENSEKIMQFFLDSLHINYFLSKMKKRNLAERSFDLRTSGLWAQHASTAPLCYHYWSPGKNDHIPWHLYPNKIICQKWDSNPRPQKWTATWTQRLRPLGHPDLFIVFSSIKYQGNFSQLFVGLPGELLRQLSKWGEWIIIPYFVLFLSNSTVILSHIPYFK